MASRVEWHFCPTSGSPLSSKNEVLPGQVIVRAGILDRLDEFEKVQILMQMFL
jgi:Glutathione-dependent formaldehyde-activating enzyme